MARNRTHRKHTFKGRHYRIVKKAEDLNDEMRNDCINYLFPRLKTVDNNREDIRFAQKIFRTLLRQSTALEG